MRKICVITGSRAEYGLLRWTMEEIKKDSNCTLQILATGTHFAKRFGETYHFIEEDGFFIDEKVPLPSEGDTIPETAETIGVAIPALTHALLRLSPDIVVLLGDRFEILAAAIAATLLKIPIAHIHGGESTLGAFDDVFRHAITKMSFFHFAAAEPYRQKIIQMGESPDRVFCFGAPMLDSLERLTFLSRGELQERLQCQLKSPIFLVTYHPVTLEHERSLQKIKTLLTSLDQFPEASLIFTRPNADPDNKIIYEMLDAYVEKEKERAFVFTSLGTLLYLSLMQHADVVIGNSSSGIIEAPALKKASVNIGDRQKGRLMSDSIVQAVDERESICEAIKKALSPDFQKKLVKIQNPYGEKGEVAKNMVNILRTVSLSEDMLKKPFYSGNFQPNANCSYHSET